MKISAIIPAYNSEGTIARALNSVLAQTRPADEIIVIDDGSTDRTAQAVQSFGSRVRLIRQANAGVSAARNTGIQAASGDWIAFLDADDEWLHEKLRLQTEHLRRHPDLKWTYGNFYQKKTVGEGLAPAHSQARISKLLREGEVFDDYFKGYVNYAYAWTSVLVIEKEIFGVAGLFEPGMKRAQDNDLWFRIAYQFPEVGYLAEPLAVYHMATPGSSTKVNDSVDFMIDLVHRHEGLSRRYRRDEAFRPCIINMVQTWIRQLIQQKRYADARCLLKSFPVYCSGRFQREMRFRLFWPSVMNPVADRVMQLKKTK
jgi:glycosyltransferase involved in cell wall biosynthesis